MICDLDSALPLWRGPSPPGHTVARARCWADHGRHGKWGAREVGRRVGSRARKRGGETEIGERKGGGEPGREGGKREGGKEGGREGGSSEERQWEEVGWIAVFRPFESGTQYGSLV